MKKSLVLISIVVLFLGSVSALDLSVEKIDKQPVVIAEMDDPATYTFIITNDGGAEMVEIYSLVGVVFEPKEKFNLPNGETTVEIEAYPGEMARKTEGNYAFEYQIKGEDDDIFKDQLTIKIVKLENVLQIEPNNIKYGDNLATVTIRNVQNLRLEDAVLRMNSVFFDDEREISLDPFGSIEVKLPVKDGVKDLAAGPYVIGSEIELNDITGEMETFVNYVEEEKIVVTKDTNGIIVRTTKIERTNEGNLEVSDRVEVTKNILTRLFTSFSVPPLSTERRGLLVNYAWEKDLEPSESWTVKVTTNYTLPFVLIILIIASALFVYAYSRTALVVRKRCAFVKTRGGEFALKVMLNVKARKQIDNIEIFDRIPSATKLYEKAGVPHKFDDKIGKLSWKIDKLNAGEERIFSYIIYSGVRIFGRLELAPATAHFMHDGKSTYVNSNRTYFVSDVHSRY